MSKQMLTTHDLASEVAFVLPDREMMAVVNQRALVAVGVAVDTIEILNNSLNNNNVCVAAGVLGAAGCDQG